MKAKRIAAFLTMLTLAFSLSACGGDKGDGQAEESPSSDSVSDRFDSLTEGRGTPAEEAEDSAAEGPADGELPGEASQPEDAGDDYWLEKAAALNEDTAELWDVYGDSFRWYYGDGVMAVRGTGTLEALGSGNAKNNMGKRLDELPEGDIVVVIEDGCTVVGVSAFYSSDRLNRIVMADSVKVVTGETFMHCELKKITLPQSISVVGKNVFSDCYSLEEITMPDSLDYVANDAFDRCYALKKINWQGQTYDSSESFMAALETADIPTDGNEPVVSDGVVVVNDIHIRVEGDTLYISGTGTMTKEDFGNYDPVNVVVEEGIIGIGNDTDGGFSDCSNLVSIILPETLGSIGSRAFSGCSGLTTITLPDGVKSIGDYAFDNCRKLTSIELSGGVESIGEKVFNNCSSLASIVLPDGVKSIGDYAFRDCSGLTSIELPASVKSIGEGAFYNCSGLTSIVLPDGMESIGPAVFQGCSGLTSITLPASEENVVFNGNLWGGLFFECSSLTSVTLPEGMTYIPMYTFEDCSSLTTIVLPNSLVGMESSAFTGCNSLSEITLGTGIKEIPSDILEYCPALTKIRLPESDDMREAVIKSGLDDSLFEWY